VGVRASLERRRLAAGERLCASSAPARAEPGGAGAENCRPAGGQKLLLFLGRCIGVGPPPLLLLLANAGYDGDSHYVHLGVERGNEPQAWARADGGTATPRGDLDGSDAPSVCRAAKHSRRVHPTRERLGCRAVAWRCSGAALSTGWSACRPPFFLIGVISPVSSSATS
jgi:hypothetical protein